MYYLSHSLINILIQRDELEVQTIVHTSPGAHSSKLCYARSDEDIPSEEVVARVQGVLVDLLLPPIQDREM